MAFFPGTAAGVQLVGDRRVYSTCLRQVLNEPPKAGNQFQPPSGSILSLTVPSGRSIIQTLNLARRRIPLNTFTIL